MDDLDIGKFCEMVKSYPTIYYSSRQDYKGNFKKRNIWITITKELFQTDKENKDIIEDYMYATKLATKLKKHETKLLTVI